MEEDTKGKAWPLADAVLTDQVRKLLRPLVNLTTLPQILDLVQQASNYKQLKKGANEGKLVLPVPSLDQEKKLAEHSSWSDLQLQKP